MYNNNHKCLKAHVLFMWLLLCIFCFNDRYKGLDFLFFKEAVFRTDLMSYKYADHADVHYSAACYLIVQCLAKEQLELDIPSKIMVY